MAAALNSAFAGVTFGLMRKDRTIRRLTSYVAPNCTIKITRQHRTRKNARSETFLLTIGAPNYAERKFIADCKRAKVRFPVSRVQVKRWPKKATSH